MLLTVLYGYYFISYTNPIKFILVYMVDVYTDTIILGMISSGANLAFTSITNRIYDYFYKKEDIPTIVFIDEFDKSTFIPYDEDSDWVHVNYLSSQT